MSEMEKIHSFLKFSLENREHILKHPLLMDEYYKRAEKLANQSEPDDLLEPIFWHKLNKNDGDSEQWTEAIIRHISLHIKAKQMLENGEIKKTIEILFNYYLLAGQFSQNQIETACFSSEASKRSKAGTDKRYVKHQLIRAEACKLLHKHKPEGGWPNRPTAAKKILPDLESFVNSLDGDDGEIYFELENIANVLAGWMENKKNKVSITFTETASREWLRKNHKSNC